MYDVSGPVWARETEAEVFAENLLQPFYSYLLPVQVEPRVKETVAAVSKSTNCLNHRILVEGTKKWTIWGKVLQLKIVKKAKL